MSFILNYAHFLSSLLRIEFMMIGIFSLFILNILVDGYNIFILFFVVVVREASLGISILILRIFFYGDDYFKRYNFLIC